MLPIVIILGWLIAFGLAAYLVTHAIKYRLLGRRRRRSESGNFENLEGITISTRKRSDGYKSRWGKAYR